MMEKGKEKGVRAVRFNLPLATKRGQTAGYVCGTERRFGVRCALNPVTNCVIQTKTPTFNVPIKFLFWDTRDVGIFGRVSSFVQLFGQTSRTVGAIVVP